ncbi:glycosyltransferase family 1 protein [Niastella caeni]|uniref:Glycosyltransferase family 1 protein n=1 Tax=Niastella caeni TaxID=2569763 RepID=A0A4S8HV35_9BACT|nr:glycosyltransferase family 1 protein [Niastella caeni]THU39518.1 glycosyltransferase family 1 protein [Niastella caeni]
MKKLYFISCFLLTIGTTVLAQETATPVLNKSNRIILHFKDTTGLFTQLARILTDRGHDIDMKDRELGILRTKPSPVPGGHSFDDQMEIKSIFRDSTITFSGVVHWYPLRNEEFRYEVTFTKKRRHVTDISWDELIMIAGLLKPASVSYLTVNIYSPSFQAWQYKRNN